MFSKRLLIAGIDPGTTLGYALIDLSGEPVDIGSSKMLDIAKLTERLISKGKIAVVGCDKKKVPDFVDKISKRLGSRVISPKDDLKVSEKKSMTKGMDFSNDHEMDALASALFALKKIKPLLASVDEVMEGKSDGKVRQELTEVILQNPEFNIKNIVEVFEKPKKEENKIVRKIVVEKEYSKDDFLELFNKLKSVQKDLMNVQKQNRKLKYIVSQDKKKQEVFLRVLDHAKREEKQNRILKNYHKKLSAADLKLKNVEKSNDQLRAEKKAYESLLSDMQGKIIVKRFRNLGNEEFNLKAKIIKKGDMLLVDDVSVISYKVLDALKGKVDLVIGSGNGKVFSDYDIKFVNSKGLNIIEVGGFAAVVEKDLRKKLQDINLVDSILEKYKSERKNRNL